jgi:anti-anti-sigma factor
MSENKQIFTFEVSSSVLILSANGSFMEFRDTDIRDAYNEAYRLLMQPESRHLLVDFSNLQYFGSTFVGILIRLSQRVHSNGGQSVLCSLSDTMEQMLKSLMLLENPKADFSFRSMPDRAAAMEYLTTSEAH